jgi:geranylgeranyl reductase family protein
MYDIIIVGAGPGGSNAARIALDGGLTVVQVDARRFPRTKPCAGGMTPKAERALALDVSPSVRRTSRNVEFNLWGKRINRFSGSNPIVFFVCRPEFDNDLVRQNRERERFEFLDGERVEHIVYDGMFRVRTTKRLLSAPQLVGADGAYSIVNRTFGISKPRGVAAAVEVNVARARLASSERFVPCFDYGVIPRGYGWIFPKDDHLSIGLYTLAATSKNLRKCLVDYMASKDALPTGDPLEGFEAHTVPVGGFRLRTPSVPVYIVGDAGGFADAQTGEGIYHAIESGRLAGVTACQVARGRRSHRSYYRRLWRSVLPDTALTWAISTRFYRNADKGMRFLENPVFWRPLIYGYSRGATFAECLLLGGLYFAQSLVSGTTCRRTSWNEPQPTAD